MGERKDTKNALLALLISAVALIFASSILTWLGEGRRIEFEQTLKERLLEASPDSKIVETIAEGYVDEIVVWTAVEPDGSISGVTIRSLHETPGVGRKVLRDTAFLQQFLGTRGDAEIGVNVEGITGATVTSRAVVRAVNEASASVTGVDVVTEPTAWGKGGEAYE